MNSGIFTAQNEERGEFLFSPTEPFTLTFSTLPFTFHLPMAWEPTMTGGFCDPPSRVKDFPAAMRIRAKNGVSL
jgi:hypothetical protein